MRKLILAAVAGLVATLLVAAPAQAATAPSGCKVGHQMGATKALYVNKVRAASVKQYYGTCGGKARNWSYVYVWESFRAKYSTKVIVSVHSYTVNKKYGSRESGREVAEYVSAPAATTSHCTAAYAFVMADDNGSAPLWGSAGAYTAKVC